MEGIAVGTLASNGTQTPNSYAQYTRRLIGFSTLEIMLSLSIGTLLIALCAQRYCIVHKEHNTAHHMMLALQDIHIVEHLLRDSAHLAGFTPCLGTRYLKTTVPVKAVSVHKQVISFEYMDMHFQEGTYALKMKSHSRYVIADCHHAEYYSQDTPTRFHYRPPIHIGIWHHETYFIKNHALYYRHHDHAERLSPYIQDIQGRIHLIHGQRWIYIQLKSALLPIPTIKIRLYND